MRSLALMPARFAIKTEALQGSVTEESGVDYQKSRIMIDYVEAAK